MEKISDYFSSRKGTEFASALPELKKQIGSVLFHPLGSTYGVEGNTFRAYTNFPIPPSGVYRDWAERTCSDLDFQLLPRQLGSAAGFCSWHNGLADSLQDHWKRSGQGRLLSFAHQHKLIDLFIKWLSRHDFGAPALSQCFISSANCALDSQTLSMLNDCLSGALPLSKPSMGNIHSVQTYRFCQSLITEFAEHFGGSRLLFDYFSYRRGNGKKR